MRRALLPASGLAALLTLLAVCWPQPARAGGLLGSCLSLCSCSVSASAVTFGSYNPLSGSAGLATGSVTVTCELLSGLLQLLDSFTIDLSSGQSGSVANRALKLTGGTSTLSYNLFSDAGMTTVWGDSTGGTPVSSSITVSVVNVGVSQTFNVYGKIPPSQVAKVGNYNDSITVTVSF
jgi:spore coat protein U-like protein